MKSWEYSPDILKGLNALTASAGLLPKLPEGVNNLIIGVGTGLSKGGELSFTSKQVAVKATKSWLFCKTNSAIAFVGDPSHKDYGQAEATLLKDSANSHRNPKEVSPLFIDLPGLDSLLKQAFGLAVLIEENQIESVTIVTGHTQMALTRWFYTQIWKALAISVQTSSELDYTDENWPDNYSSYRKGLASWCAHSLIERIRLIRKYRQEAIESWALWHT